MLGVGSQEAETYKAVMSPKETHQYSWVGFLPPPHWFFLFTPFPCLGAMRTFRSYQVTVWLITPEPFHRSPSPMRLPPSSNLHLLTKS